MEGKMMVKNLESSGIYVSGVFQDSRFVNKIYNPRGLAKMVLLPIYNSKNKPQIEYRKESGGFCVIGDVFTCSGATEDVINNKVRTYINRNYENLVQVEI